jgi:hypothetical protein
MIKVSCTFNWNGWKSKPRNAYLEFGKDNRLAAMAE